MGIVYQTDKRSGITYAYENQSFWDPELKRSKSKRKLIGRVDPETKEIIPTDGRCKKRSPSYIEEPEGYVMHTDFTSGRVNGKNVQIILCANQDEMLYFLREHKGHEGIKNTPVAEYQQILIHDHDVTFYKYGADHQECLAHVLRYLQDSIDNEKDLTWNTQMKSFLSGIIHQVKQDRNLSEQEIASFEAKYDEILILAEKEYTLHPPGKYYPEGYNLYERMCKFKHNHLLFLRHLDLEYTNNLAERSLRKLKRKLKQAVTYRSIQSIEALCNCLGIIETGRLRGGNLFSICEEVFLRSSQCGISDF